MTPSLPQQQEPSLFEKLINFLFGQKALQQAAQGPQQPNPVTPAQNTGFLQDQVSQYMTNLKAQQDADKKKKKLGQ